MGKKVTIDLEAGVAQFVNSMDKAGDTLRQFGRHTDEARGTLQRFMENMELGAGIEAGRQAFEQLERPLEKLKESFREIEELGHHAEAIGVTTQSLSRLEYAATAAGVGTETVTSALTRMERSLGTAAAEGGTTLKMLESFGFDVRTLTSMAPDQAFRKIAQQLEAMHDPFQRAAAANQIFGRGWTEILPLLQQGQEGLDRLSAAADRSGYVLTDKQVEADHQAIMAIRELSLAADGFARQMAVAVSPIVQGVAEDLLKLSGSADEMQRGMNAAVQGAIPAIALLADALQDVTNVARYCDEAILDIGQALNTIGDAIPAFTNMITVGLIPGLNDFVGKMHDAHQVMELAHDDLEKQIEDSHKVSYGDQIRKELDRLTHSAQEAKSAGEETFAGIDAAADDAAASIGRIGKAAKETKSELEKLYERSAEAAQTFGMSQSEKEIAKLREMKNPYSTADLGTNLHQQMQYADWETTRRSAIANYELVESLEAQKKATEEADREHKRAAESAARSQRQLADEAQRMWKEAETPLQKYHDQIAQLDRLMKGHLLTVQQYNQIAAHDKADFDKQTTPHHHHEERERSADLISRSFDFRIGGGQSGNAQEKLVKHAERSEQLLNRWDNWLNLMYQSITGTGGAGTTQSVFDYS